MSTMTKTAFSTRSGSDEAHVRLYTQNLFGVLFAKDKKKRLTDFVSFIDDTPRDAFLPDFVSVNEAFFRKMQTHLQQSKYQKHWAFTTETGFKFGDSGLGLGSHYPIIDTEFRPFPEAANIDALINKGVMRLTVKHPDLGEIDFYVTHTQASYKSPGQYASVRRAGSALIADMIDERDRKFGKRTVVIAGDFNCAEDEFSLRLLTEHMGFRDVMREMHPSENLDTWRAENPYVKDSETNQRLDYILLRPGDSWEWDEEKSTGQIVRPCQKKDDLCLPHEQLSDHDGVYVDLALKRH